ncbi:MAG: starch-binding protein [Bacilli bacterium]|jgi:hypothetical protein
MKTKIKKRWLLNGIITTLLFGIVMIPIVKDEIAVKTDAASNIPVLVGEPIGWNEHGGGNDEYILIETSPGSNIYTKTFTSLESGRYQLVKKGTWNRFPAIEYDGNNSKPGKLIFPTDDSEKNFYLLNSGTVTFTMYNPDNLPGSPLGPRRFTVDFSSSPANAQSHLVLSGDAVGGWATNVGTNRLKGEAGFDGRYLSIVHYLSAADFKIFIWNSSHLGDWGWSSYDASRSNASGSVQQSGTNIKITSAAFYKVVFDTKIMKIFVHSDPTTHQVVSKYDGATLLEKEAAFSGISYNPTPCPRPNKRFDGWFTDAALNNPYTPGTVSGPLSLYGKYVAEQDVKLSFYDRNQAISTGNVYAYGWNPGVGETLGGWPGTKMNRHGLGYHSLDIPFAKVSQKILFNNGLSGGPAGGEVKTADLDWGPGNNLYTHHTSSWGVMSATHHSATLFGIRILHETNEGCGAQSSTLLSGAWTTLSGEFSALNSDVKTDLKNATANFNGDLVAQAAARYDIIALKYSYSDFINRITPPPGGVREPQAKERDRFATISVISGFALIAIIGVSILRKRRYN